MLGSNVDVDRARETITAIPPRRLRLDELLRELGADDGTRHDGAASAFPSNQAVDTIALERLTLAEGSSGMPAKRPEALTVGELVDKASEAGFGFLIGILTLIAIPFFGLSTPFGLAIALVGAQLMVGRTKPWLPRRARDRALRMSMLDRVLGILARRTRWLARSTRRRWEFLIRTRLVGLGVFALALALALPLPIPGSNMVFLIPLFIYAIGLLERDGLWIALGHLCVLVHTVLFVVFSKTIVMVFEQIAGWFS
jgi:hypothetical protein